MKDARHYGYRHLARLLPLLAVVLLFGGMSLGAQETHAPLFVGVAAGYEWGWEWSRFPVFASEPECDQFTTGAVGGAGVGPMLLLPSIGGSRIGGMIRMSGVRATGDFTFAPPDSLILFQDESHQVVRAGHEYHYRTTATMLRLDLLCTYAVSDRLDAGLGVSVGYRGATDGTAVESLPADGALRFPDGALERGVTDAASLTWRPLGLGALLRAGGRLPMGGGMMLAPEISLRADLLSEVDGIDLRSVMVGGSLALLYDLAPRAPQGGAVPPPPVGPVAPVASDPPPAPVEDAPPPARPIDTSLTASIDLYGLDEKEGRTPTATITVMETHRRLLLLPARWVDFDAGSSILPAIYRRRGGRFTLDSLWSLDQGSLPLLDIVGALMRRSPAATLALTGGGRRGEPAAIRRARAESVRRYLAGAWSVDTARLLIEESGLSRGGGVGGRVLLRAEPASLLDSVVVELTTRDPDPPLIALDPIYHAAAGVRRWSITLSYDGRQVGRYTSDDPDAIPALNWRGAGESGAPLVADLLVEDSLGGEVTASARLPLLLQRGSRVVERTIVQERGAERLLFSVPRQGSDAVIAEVVAAMHDGARVTVGDAAGDEGSAARELLRRLRGAADAKGVRGVVWAEGGGGARAGDAVGDDPIVTVEQRLGGR